MNTAYKMQLRLKFLQGSSLVSVSRKKRKYPEENFQSSQIGKRLTRKWDFSGRITQRTCIVATFWCFREWIGCLLQNGPGCKWTVLQTVQGCSDRPCS